MPNGNIVEILTGARVRDGGVSSEIQSSIVERWGFGASLWKVGWEVGCARLAVPRATRAVTGHPDLRIQESSMLAFERPGSTVAVRFAP